MSQQGEVTSEVVEKDRYDIAEMCLEEQAHLFSFSAVSVAVAGGVPCQLSPARGQRRKVAELHCILYAAPELQRGALHRESANQSGEGFASGVNNGQNRQNCVQSLSFVTIFFCFSFTPLLYFHSVHSFLSSSHPREFFRRFSPPCPELGTFALIV